MQFDVIDLGYCEYQDALNKQEQYHNRISKNQINNSLIFVEHNPVYTLGKNADKSNILQSFPEDVDVHQIDRGGDVTYHGPGQLVGYPIFNIKEMNMSIGRYVHTLENILINTLDEFGIEAQIRDKLIGVWVGIEKIAAIGVRVIDGVTKHGFALNINPDLRYFEGIVPCGIDDCQITSMERVLKKSISFEKVQNSLIDQFQKNFI